jgi:class 3 adenylate cyclase
LSPFDAGRKPDDMKPPGDPFGSLAFRATQRPPPLLYNPITTEYRIWLRGRHVCLLEQKGEHQMPAQRQVSILFADVKGFTSLRGAEVDAFVRTVLPGFAGKLALLNTKPIVVNTWGDGIFLVFDTADHAARCAIDLRDLVRDTHWPTAGIHGNLEIRIALHNAHALVMDDPITGKMNAYGPHINMAARLEPVTKPNEIFATEEFKRTLDLFKLPAYSWDQVGPLALAKN